MQIIFQTAYMYLSYTTYTALSHFTATDS